MDFIKKNYEKILLAVVLLGLVGALIFLPFLIAGDKQKQADLSGQVLNPRVTALPDLDMTVQSNIWGRLQSTYPLDFERTNKLFNPVEWQKTTHGDMVKATTSVGPQVAVVTNITPLYLIITLDSVVTNELGIRYVLYVERQGAASPSQRRRVQRYVSTDDRKKDVFTLMDIKGAPENPDQLTLRLADTGESAAVSKDKPFQRVDGYMADIKYDPESKNWAGQRVGSHLRFAGDDYTIVDINSNEVILSAQSNQKRWTLQLHP